MYRKRCFKILLHELIDWCVAFLPTAYWVWGKVMFSQACAILFTRGVYFLSSFLGGLLPDGGILPEEGLIPEVLPERLGVWSGGGCLVRWWVSSQRGRQTLPRWLLPRSVCILLECILVWPEMCYFIESLQVIRVILKEFTNLVECFFESIFRIDPW